MFTAAATQRDRRQLGGDPEWWRGAVIYQIYPRSFLDASGDGVGDLAGIAAKLDYVASLGVDAIWISPFFTSPMKDYGYDVADYRGVDPLFGGLEDFDALLAAAHHRGLRVLLDAVLSHTSDQHPWFRESRVDRTGPKAEWYVWADPKAEGSPPNNWLSFFGGPAWEWDSRRRQYYQHNFLREQPDLNFHNPEVQEAMLGALRFWLDRGVDGFRFDTVNMYFHDANLRDNPPIGDRRIRGMAPENPFGMQAPIHNINRPETERFAERIRALMDEYDAATTVGEIGAALDTHAATVAYTAPGRLHMAYSFDFLERDVGPPVIRRAVEAMGVAAGSWPCWAFSNHDVERVLSRWEMERRPDRAGPMLVALLASLRGTACLYQGEELGLPEAHVPFDKLQDPYGVRFWPEVKGRDGCRTPMPWSSAARHGGFTDGEPWLPCPPEHAARAVSVQEGDPGSALSRTRAFLAWRRRQPALIRGDLVFRDAPDGVVAFTRRHEGASLFCAFNLGETEARLPAPAALRAQEAAGFEGRIEGNEIVLPPSEALFAADEGEA
jgi:alpha-glucosidase